MSCSKNDFAEALAASLAEVFSQALMAPWTAEVRSDLPDTNESRSQHNVVFVLSGGLTGSVALGVALGDAIRFGEAFAGIDAKEPHEFTSEHKEAVDELFRQIAGKFATSVNGKAGEVLVQFSPEGSCQSTCWQFVIAVAQGDHTSEIEVCLDKQLVGCLSRSTQNKPNVAENALSGIDVKNLNLLLDIELDASLRFGQTRLLLRDILELGPGSVVELDRDVQEPVELLVNGKMIARGEVVLIDGDYGLRVTEVCPPQSRIDLLPSAVEEH